MRASNQSVFLVLSGCYSNTSTDSIWSTREKAEARVAEMGAPASEDRTHHRTYDEPRLQEWYLDNVPPDVRPLWLVHFRADAVEVHPQDKTLSCLTASNVFVGLGHKYQQRGNARIYVHADTAETAIKVASDRRAAVLAQAYPPDADWAGVP